jgi:hypothetical protein
MKRVAALLVLSSVVVHGQGTSRWVSMDGQRLRYTSDARGNRIMDFSHAGYGGGGVALPDVRAARTLDAVPGDNTARIQAAIDEVSRLQPDASGLRGAVVLAAGTFDVAGTLTLAVSGVVLRGSGSGGPTANPHASPTRTSLPAPHRSSLIAAPA